MPTTTNTQNQESWDHEEFLNKLEQIEEHARTTLAALPNTHLMKERMVMVMALVRYVRTAIGDGGLGTLCETISRPSDNGDREQRMGWGHSQ